MEEAEARFLLTADDTAVIQATAERLVRERTVEAMSYLCEAIASNENDEVGEEVG